jgi:hypothetical protein
MAYPSNTRVAVIDIDTTLANNEHRASKLVYQDDGEIEATSWAIFCSDAEMAKDHVQPLAKEGLNHLRRMGYHLTFLTGRQESFRKTTEHWLRTNALWIRDIEPLVMRTPEYTGWSASSFKEDAFQRNIKTRDITYTFFDDDLHVLKVFSKYGLTMRCPEAWTVLSHPEPRNTERALAR